MRVLLLIWGLAAARAAGAGDCQPDPDTAIRTLNAVRAEAQRCGARSWPAVAPLRWHETLALAAQRHAAELASLDRLEHVSLNGATPRARLREAGYAMRITGENLAGGAETLAEALDQWVASAAHCENVMFLDFEHAGLACATGSGRLQRYWVLTLAAPARTAAR
ncbi:MAG: CAP domain-containing protein [Variovorax sp.]|nr:MAG: CAP domain-containing protein [Variovorax sp.]